MKSLYDEVNELIIGYTDSLGSLRTELQEEYPEVAAKIFLKMFARRWTSPRGGISKPWERIEYFIERDDVTSTASWIRKTVEWYSRCTCAALKADVAYHELEDESLQIGRLFTAAITQYQLLLETGTVVDQTDYPQSLYDQEQIDDDLEALEVLYYLDEPRTVADIADPSDNYHNTVNRILKRFRDRGLVGTDDGRYDFNGDFDRLHAFARELAHHLHRQRLESVTPNGTILWEDYDEFLAQTETATDAAKPRCRADPN